MMSIAPTKRFRMTALFRIAFLSGVLFLHSAQTHATSVGIRTDHCPFCHRDYMVMVLLSYTNFTGDDGPPAMPPSSCSFCLAVWTGGPPKELTEQQRQALNAALASWPDELSVSERQNLLRELDLRYSDSVRERIISALQARCAAALEGKELPKFVVKPSRVGRDWDLKDHETFLRELPRLIEAQKNGQEAVIKPESAMASEDIVTLQQARREIVNANALAFEYLVRWTVAVDDAVVLDRGRVVGDVFGDILFDVARSNKLPWPKDVDIGRARSSFAAACLQYAYEPDRQPDEPLREAISTFRPFERAQIALKAAAGKMDRAAARWISSPEPSRGDMYGDAFTLYYQSVGNAEDLPFLETCATNAMNQFKSAAKQGRDDGWRYRHQLKAYEIVRLKCQLMGEPVSFAPAK
jgi:hypothetical protein